jgi:hypothetical protein
MESEQIRDREKSYFEMTNDEKRKVEENFRKNQNDQEKLLAPLVGFDFEAQN